MNKVSCNISNFEELINGNYLYVDKTEFIWNLVKREFEGYLLYRPNNFGKSLTLSTIKAVFEGKKELFKGLAIYQKDYDWKKYPIIHFELKNYNFETLDNIESSFKTIIQQQALINDIMLTTNDAHDMFCQLIEELYQKSGDVVILIDDYDKPFTDNNFTTKKREIQLYLYDFYGVIKAKNSCLRTVLLTGVCWFYLADMLSGGLNNLLNVSYMSNYATMYGYTDDELEIYFKEHIAQIAAMQNTTVDNIKTQIAAWYGNYCFDENSAVVYNPLSLAQFINNNGKFEIYKSNDNISTLLQEISSEQMLDENEVYEISKHFLFPFELNEISLVYLMIYAGLFTIKEVVPYFNEDFLKVDFPNIETKEYWNLLLTK